MKDALFIGACSIGRRSGFFRFKTANHLSFGDIDSLGMIKFFFNGLIAYSISCCWPQLNWTPCGLLHFRYSINQNPFIPRIATPAGIRRVCSSNYLTVAAVWF
jgi:hypothetical protein